ncbi:MAG: hypothetical protein EP343_22570 [Deltaproteobacteria bacterium]|nr:MAG: hypothetical protein EP343_22570 [Deltaproteobacteria bacterium]
MANSPSTTPNSWSRHRWRSLCLIGGLLALSLFSINCGMYQPPRVWKCECLQVCLDKDGNQIASIRPLKLTQLACGYTRTGALYDAAQRCDNQPVDGCARTACTCSTCFFSRKHVCRQRARAGVAPVPGTIDDDDTVWVFDSDDDDDVDVYEEEEWLDSDAPYDDWIEDDTNNWSDDNTDDNWSDDNWSDDNTDDNWSDDNTDDWGDDDWGDDDWSDDP